MLYNVRYLIYSHRERRKFESRCSDNDEKMEALEKSLQEALLIAEDSGRRHDESARRLAIMEVDLERAEDRADTAEEYATIKYLKAFYLKIEFYLSIIYLN
jgi:hypothetical protein